jgi:hypothetical protein
MAAVTTVDKIKHFRVYFITIIIIIIYSSFAPHGAQGFDSASPSEAPVSVSWIY